jgi:hypothetical protein
MRLFSFHLRIEMVGCGISGACFHILWDGCKSRDVFVQWESCPKQVVPGQYQDELWNDQKDTVLFSWPIFPSSKKTKQQNHAGAGGCENDSQRPTTDSQEDYKSNHTKNEKRDRARNGGELLIRQAIEWSKLLGSTSDHGRLQALLSNRFPNFRYRNVLHIVLGFGGDCGSCTTPRLRDSPPVYSRVSVLDS